MKIIKDYNLKELNTFGIEAKAKFFVEINFEEDIKELIESSEFQQNEKLFLGGGSNVLFTHDFDGMVILNKVKGIEIIKEDDNYVWIKGYGGENWHEFVMFAVDKELWGLENLSLIPGTVGAAPMQNIGAYGAELKNILESVEAYDIKTGEKIIFQEKECECGYRTSIFKTSAKGKYFISAIVVKLSKNKNLNISYKVLENYLKENNIKVENPKDISDAVIAIRTSRLPDPKILGNAGSFFKNAFVDENKVEELKKNYLDLPTFIEETKIKIPAGWLIEQCAPRQGGASWKGYRMGNVGVHDKQALVLVNYGGASGAEVKELSDQIITSVFEKFGIKLEREVNLI